MASTIEQIDAYLKKNKKPLFSNLNNWYGKNDTDAKNLKFLWNAAQDAKGINNKIEAFRALQEELAHWTDLEELERQEAELTEAGADNWTDPQAKVEMDKMRFFGQLSNTPSIDKLTDLSIDDVYSQGYDYEQMKALANEYGYDYTDKDDRKEFLDKLSKYQQEKDLEDIWNGDLYTSLITPIAKEYAKQNYQNIENPWQLVPVVAADAGVNTLMAGVPGGAAGKYLKFAPKGQMVVNNTVAPAARAGLNMSINDESFGDAAKDALNEAATNFAFRFGMRGAQRYGKELIPTGGKQTVQGRANEMANAARDRANIHFRKPKPKVDENGFATGEYDGFDYFVYDKNGVPKPSSYKAWANDPNRMINQAGSTVELEAQKDALLTSKRLPFSEKTNANIVKNLEKAGTEPEQMLYDEVAAMGAPRESFWNFAMNNPVSKDVGSYINNLQGRSKWGGAALGAIANYDPTQTVSQKTFEKQPKLSKQDKAELELLQRLRDLHDKNPEFFKAPKIPDKFKDYFNDAQKTKWNDNVKINDIFD